MNTATATDRELLAEAIVKAQEAQRLLREMLGTGTARTGVMQILMRDFLSIAMSEDDVMTRLRALEAAVDRAQENIAIIEANGGR